MSNGSATRQNGDSGENARDQPNVRPVDHRQELRLTVVEYEECPNRGTVHPPGLAGIGRMETWLSANTTAFVSLTAWR